MAKPKDNSKVFVRTFVAGTIAFALVSAPSHIMAEEVVPTPSTGETTPVTEPTPTTTPVTTDENTDPETEGDTQPAETPAPADTSAPAVDAAPASEEPATSVEEAPVEETPAEVAPAVEASEGEEAPAEDAAPASEETSTSVKEAPAKETAPVADEAAAPAVDVIPDGAERQMDAATLAEIIKGDRTFENGNVDLRLLGKKGILQVGRDTDEDGILDEAEVLVFEKDGKKYFKYTTDPVKKDSDGDGVIDSEDPRPLTWDFSERDAYMFAKLAYREDADLEKVFSFDQAGLVSAFDVLDEKSKKNVPEAIATDLGNKTLVASQREFARYWRPVLTIHEASGLDAVLFEFNNAFYPYLQPNGTYAIAFRGTDPSGDGDKTDDAWLALGKFTNQGEDIVDFNKELIGKTGRFSAFDIRSLSVTGHSLGGYLSQVFLADMQGGTVGNYKTKLNSSDIVKGVYTFNAAPIVVRGGWFGSPQQVKDLKDAGDKLNAAHLSDPSHPVGTPEHRHFVINGEIVTNMLGGFEHKEVLGPITSTQDGDNPNSTQAHYLSNFAREQYANIFDEGIRKGFTETEILPLLTSEDGYLEDEFIGKVGLTKFVTLKTAEGKIFAHKFYTLKGFNKCLETLNATGLYDAEVGVDGAVYTLKKAPEYSIIEKDEKEVATDYVYTHGQDEFGLFVSDGDFDTFESFEIDGRVIDATKYTVESGSTIVKVEKEVMDTLNNGEHTVAMRFANGGVAAGNFTVENAPLTDMGVQTDPVVEEEKETATTETQTDPVVEKEKETATTETQTDPVVEEEKETPVEGEGATDNTDQGESVVKPEVDDTVVEENAGSVDTGDAGNVDGKDDADEAGNVDGVTDTGDVDTNTDAGDADGATDTGDAGNVDGATDTGNVDGTTDAGNTDGATDTGDTGDDDGTTDTGNVDGDNQPSETGDVNTNTDAGNVDGTTDTGDVDGTTDSGNADGTTDTSNVDGDKQPSDTGDVNTNTDAGNVDDNTETGKTEDVKENTDSNNGNIDLGNAGVANVETSNTESGDNKTSGKDDTGKDVSEVNNSDTDTRNNALANITTGEVSDNKHKINANVKSAANSNSTSENSKGGHSGVSVVKVTVAKKTAEDSANDSALSDDASKTDTKSDVVAGVEVEEDQSNTSAPTTAVTTGIAATLIALVGSAFAFFGRKKD